MSTDNAKRRVVITGLGVVSSIGIGWQEFWKNLIAGKSGISKIEAFDTSQYDRQYAGEVKNFDSSAFIKKNKAKNLGRASKMLIAATQMAIEDSQIKKDISKSFVSIGTTVGELRLLEEFNDDVNDNMNNFSKTLFFTYPCSALSMNISSFFKFNGGGKVFTTACAAGNYALGHGFDLIRSGKFDYVFAGGGDAFSRVIYTGFSKLLSVAPKMCQPFDKNRKGMIPGEGAAILLMESMEMAEKRNAKIYGEVLGYGLSCDGKHMTMPSYHGVAKSIKKSILKSGLDNAQIDYICAHGTGTKQNDITEAKALNFIFGNKINTLPVSSIKSMLGHTMGAASALESISCLLSLNYGIIPPTINVDEQDEECKILCVLNNSIEKKLDIVLNNSQAFGGNNCCLALSKV